MSEWVGPDQQWSEVRDWLDAAARIVVLTGAGISTDSGIPDYRGPQGTWTRNPGAERAASLDHYLQDPDVRRQAWRSRLSSPIWSAQPNAGHRALVELEARGQLLALVTQNVDGLHRLAGTSEERLIEIHGNARAIACWDCGTRYGLEETLARVRGGDDDPRCGSCGGILKSTTISFGQSLVRRDLVRAEEAARSCDLMLAVGTTLTVSPACDLVPLAHSRGSRVVIINQEPTAFDHLAAAVVSAGISEVLPRLLSASA